MSVWDSEASLEALTNGESHREAMEEGYAGVRSFRFKKIWLKASELPISWDRAEELLSQPDREFKSEKGAKP